MSAGGAAASVGAAQRHPRLSGPWAAVGRETVDDDGGTPACGHVDPEGTSESGGP